MRRLLPAAAALLLAAGAVRAEGPVPPVGGSDPVEDLKKASIEVSRALKANEEALTKVAQGETADPKPVDIRLPENPGPKSSSSGGGT